MPDSVLDNISHRRYNPLRGTWVLVAPHRAKRPWLGQQETPSRTTLPDYDPSCYLCPGNKRAEGDINPNFESTFVFVNDFSALQATQEEYTPPPQDGSPANRLLQADAVTGKCFVLTFSPTHNLTLADFTPRQILPIVRLWTDLYAAHLSPSSPLAKQAEPTTIPPLARDEDPLAPHRQYRYMVIFENKGAAMGCSNPHPHGQVWAMTGLPEEPAMELAQLQRYRREHKGAHMLQDYVAVECEAQERIVFQNSAFVALCPWWAIWPFEVMIISKAHRRALVDLAPVEQAALAEAVAEVTRRYDNLFETQFPYSMGIHQAPLEGTAEEVQASHLHVHFFPPLLRSATVKKFFVGYEMLAEPQRDITPEVAAERLRNCGGELYRKKLEDGPETS